MASIRLLPVVRASALALFLTLGLSSCFEAEIVLYLNADGSGKTLVKVKQPKDGATAGMAGLMQGLGGVKGASPATPVATGGDSLAPLVVGAKGLDAWTNYRKVTDADGSITEMARGFFPDVNKFYMNSGQSASGKESPVLERVVAADGSEVLRLPSFDVNEAIKEMMKSQGSEEAPKSEEEVTKALAGLKQSLPMMTAMFAPMISGIKIKLTVQPAGTITDYGAFNKAADNQAYLETSGEKVLQSLNEVMKDEALMRSMMMNKLTAEQAKSLLGKFIGLDKELAIKTAKPTTASDYKAELAKAKQQGDNDDLKAFLKRVEESKAKRPPPLGQ